MTVLTMEGWLATAPAWIAGLPDGLQWLAFQLYQTFIYQDRWTWFANGLKITFLVTIGALALGVVLGLLVAIIRTAHDSQRAGKHNPILGVINVICKLYLTVIRGTPMMIQLMITYFVIFGFAPNGYEIPIAVFAFGFNSGAYVAEIIRAGILSIDRGQMEAGRSLGLSKNTTMKCIIMPQAIKNILPALFNEVIVLIKKNS